MRFAARVGLSVAALLAAGGAPATAIDDSQGSPGFCPDENGVTVVVDLTELGGEVIVRCAPGSEKRTGYDALVDAGFEIEGTARFGQSTVCRIEGRPAADEGLDIDGKAGYREGCVDMPPAGAYWSYWNAENGGDWSYSQQGTQSRQAITGGFEGWSFALNSTSATPSAPSIGPVRPNDPADESDGSDGSDGPDENDATGGTGQSDGSDGSDGSASQAKPNDGGNTDAQGESTGEGLPKPMKRESSPPPTAGEQNGVEWTGGDASNNASAPATDDAGSDAAPWVAGGVIAALTLLIAGTTLRRRARRGVGPS